LFDALAMGARAPQGSAATSTANLAIIGKATGASLSLLRSEPPNIFSPTLAPPTSVLASMQRVYLANGNLDYTSLLPTSSIVDPSFSASAS
jgi:NitT/TauT family transport system substrate-binding protein